MQDELHPNTPPHHTELSADSRPSSELNVGFAVELATLVDDAYETLVHLQSDELDYWLANTITHRSLRDLVMIDNKINTVTAPEWLQRRHSELDLFLPFDGTEREILRRNIDEMSDESTKWYEEASPEQLVLIDRWRRWLTIEFDEEKRDDPNSPGQRLIGMLDKLNAELEDGPLGSS